MEEDRVIPIDRTAEPIETRSTFEERMAKKHEAEEMQREVERERLRAAYLKRTGRTEMKP